MSQHKKEIRNNFRQKVFERDKFKCRKCGIKSSECPLDAHHITDRSLMPNGGYVSENGISLCDQEHGCHWKAEQFHITGKSVPGYSPEELYCLIGSSYEKAVIASDKLNRRD